MRKESWIDRNGLPLIIFMIVGIPFTAAMIGQYQLYKKSKEQQS